LSPVISIILPTYNCALYLGQAIDSVIAQTFSDWELLIVDNHSDDGTEKIIAAYDDERISNFSIHNNGIIAASRNLALNHARGEWVAFLDADDYWDKDKLRACLEKGEQGFDLVYHPMSMLYNSRSGFRRKSTKSRQLKHPVFRDLMTGGNPIVNSSVLVRTAKLAEINFLDEDPAIRTSEDYDAWLKLSLNSERFGYILTNYGVYRVHETSASNALDKTVPHETVITRHIGLLDEKDQLKSRAMLHYIRGRKYFAEKHYDKARQQLSKAVKDLDKALFAAGILFLFLARLRTIL